LLKGIDPLLTPDLLHALASMGHGDEIAIVDANFPAVTIARRLIAMPGADTLAVLRAVLSLFPLDTFERPAAFTMQVVGDANAIPPPVAAFREALAPNDVGSIERHAFYARARNAFAVVQTGELRKYGNVLLVKGVIATS